MKTLDRVIYHLNKFLITEAMARELTLKSADDDSDTESEDYDDVYNIMHNLIDVMRMHTKYHRQP